MSALLNTNPSAVRVLVTNERVTGIPGAEMLRLALHDTNGPLDVLDNCCGGGVITAKLLEFASEQTNNTTLNRIVAADIDQNVVDYVHERIGKSGWTNVEAMQFDQQAPPLPDSTFSHIFSNFGVFFCANDSLALQETSRLLRPGGTAAFTTWKKISWTTDFALPALAKFIPDAPTLPDPTGLFPQRGWNAIDSISAKLRGAGFRNVRVEEYSFSPGVEHAEFAEATAVLMRAIAGKVWAKEVFEKYGGEIEPAILRYLQEEYPAGKWDGVMTAFISIGQK